MTVVVTAGDLNQATTPKALTVAVRFRGVAQTRGQCAGVVLAQVLSTAQLAHVLQLPRLMADLREESGDAFGGIDVVVSHGAVEWRNENARLSAGVEVYLE
ncbi:hypothetical protein D3C71_1786230 [compost metagenome]